MQFRRAANGYEIFSELETKHVGRRIAETQTAIKIEGVAGEFGFETLRQDDLENIARSDEFFRLRNDRFKLFACGVALRGRKFASRLRRKWSQNGRSFEFFNRYFQIFERSIVSVVG